MPFQHSLQGDICENMSSATSAQCKGAFRSGSDLVEVRFWLGSRKWKTNSTFTLHSVAEIPPAACQICDGHQIKKCESETPIVSIRQEASFLLKCLFRRPHFQKHASGFNSPLPALPPRRILQPRSEICVGCRHSVSIAHCVSQRTAASGLRNN